MIARVEESTEASITVAEVSSFQLELIDTLRPDVAVLLNLTPDHIDRHGSLEAYSRAKARIFENQTDRDAAVLNADDVLVDAVRSRAAAYLLVQPHQARR